MIPHLDTPVDDQPSKTIWRPGALVALQHLRTELHTHRIYPTLSYRREQPYLVINAKLNVWADQAGALLSWGPRPLGEPADQAPTADLPQAARHLAEHLGKHYTEPADPP